MISALLLSISIGFAKPDGAGKIRTPFLENFEQTPLEKIESIKSNFPDSVAIDIPTQEKVYALTFDDGPGNMTAAILDLLKKEKIKATFCVVGSRVKERPDLFKRIVEEGHMVCNHSYTHEFTNLENFKNLKEQEIVPTEIELAKLGYKVEKIYRPPYGKISNEAASLLTAEGYKILFWSIDSIDWFFSIKDSKKALVDRIKRYIHPGAILLFHDYNGANKELLIKALPEIILYLKNKNYRSVLLSSDLKNAK